MIKNILNYSLKKIQERAPAREILFEAQIVLESLDEVPIQGHSFYVTWKFRNPQHQPLLMDGGQTSMEPMSKLHRVEWKEALSFAPKKQTTPQISPVTQQNNYVTLRVNQKTNTLNECYIDFKVFYRPTPQARSSRLLGTAAMNLSIYALDNRRTVHSFLLKNTNLNSTLKISVLLVQKSGDKFFKCPVDKQRTHSDFTDDNGEYPDLTIEIVGSHFDDIPTRKRQPSIDTCSSTNTETEHTNSTTASMQMKTPTSPEGASRHNRYGSYSVDPSNQYTVNNDEVVNNIFMNELSEGHAHSLDSSSQSVQHSRTGSFESNIEPDHMTGIIDNIIKRHTTNDVDYDSE